MSTPYDNLKLSDRTFKCQICNHELDRDLNAALNLKKLYTVSSTGIHALGDGSSSNESSVSPSLKKESNGKFTYVLKHSVDFCKF